MGQPMTNLKHIHPLVVDTLAGQSYAPKKDRIGVTTLAGPPLCRQLRFKYHPYLTVDASEQLWALLGTVAHKVILQNPSFGWTFETKVTRQIRKDWPTLTGYIDGYNFLTGELIDFKMTSVWSIIFGLKDGKPDWSAQLNMYAAMCRLLGANVTKLNDIAIMRDHQASKCLSDKDYPETPFYTFPSKLWTDAEAEEYIMHRFDLHTKKATECTDEEKWKKADSFAVMKTGGKRAAKVESVKADADAWISRQKKPDDYVVEVRPGGCGKCEKYCSVREVCPFSPCYNQTLVKRVYDYEKKMGMN
jgi:hypothetical protein